MVRDSKNDATHCEALASSGTPIGKLALRPVVRVGSGAWIAQVALAMRTHNVSCVLVGDEGYVLTERDLTRALAEGRGPETKAADIATHNYTAASADTRLGPAAALMVRRGIRHLPVQAKDGETMGLLEMEAALRILLRDAGALAWQTDFEGLLADGG